MERLPGSAAPSSQLIWERFHKQKGRTSLPGPFEFVFCLFGGCTRACCEKRWQFTNFWLLGTGGIGASVTTGRPTPTGPTLTRLAGLACISGGVCGRCSFVGHCGLLVAGRFAFIGYSNGRTLTIRPFPIGTLTAALIARRTLFALLSALLAALVLLVTLILLRRLLRLGRREARVHLGHIIIEIAIVLALGPHATLGLLGARNDTEIMLGMLEIILRHHRVTARLGVAGELQIFLGDMGRVAAHLYIRTIALEIAGQRINVLASAVPTALPVFILIIGSHLVALSNSRKISVTLLADRHHA
ncbi:MAG: hypothetical protein ACI9GK_001296 [Devosia sp.]|jgi:hypothetical protein|tara:strand:+ start:7156 stop:8061 length:906 start_codon:yes stop_codon:yes gene_type:complete